VIEEAFDIRACGDEATLERVLQLVDGFLMRATKMSDEALRDRLRRCPGAFHCVLRAAPAGQDELVGYFILLPLNRNCCEALGAGTIRSGREIQLLDLAGPSEEIQGLYLSVVCAIGPRAQSAAIKGIFATLRELHARKNVRYLFVRAATEAGARMLERLSNTTFEADGRIHSIDMAGYDFITAQAANF
jgi:hypothetical protein